MFRPFRCKKDFFQRNPTTLMPWSSWTPSASCLPHARKRQRGATRWLKHRYSSCEARSSVLWWCIRTNCIASLSTQTTSAWGMELSWCKKQSVKGRHDYGYASKTKGPKRSTKNADSFAQAKSRPRTEPSSLRWCFLTLTCNQQHISMDNPCKVDNLEIPWHGRQARCVNRGGQRFPLILRPRTPRSPQSSTAP